MHGFANGKPYAKNLKADLIVHIERLERQLEAKQTRIVRQREIIERNRGRHHSTAMRLVTDLKGSRKRFNKLFDSIYK